MRKIILLLTFFVISMSNAQTKLEQYVAINGITYKVGDRIMMGIGSGYQGTFVNLKLAGWAAGSSTQIGSGYNGLNLDIKKIKKYTFKGSDKIIFTVGGGNITNYSLDIDAAIATCEVKDCNYKNNDVYLESDKYDKIKKLKSLLDDGTITKDEYEIEKKKLLN